MEAVDGNAVAGALCEHFGVDMTTAHGACGHCGTRSMVAELARLRSRARRRDSVSRVRRGGDGRRRDPRPGDRHHRQFTLS